MQTNVSNSVDIDVDLFHAVTMTEDLSWKKGYNAGFVDGREKGFQEGFKLGAVKGQELGAEIGFYNGFVSSVLTNYCSSSESRIKKTCESILKLTQSLENIDPMSEDLSVYLTNLQGKFKQDLMKIGKISTTPHAQ